MRSLSKAKILSLRKPAGYTLAGFLLSLAVIIPHHLNPMPFKNALASSMCPVMFG